MHRRSYKGGHAAAVKRWKESHPKDWREQKSLVKAWNQIETEGSAENRSKPWTAKEIRYMRLFGSRLTAKEIALKLGRTYFAVQHKTRTEKIDLSSKEKKKSSNNSRWRIPPPD